MLIQIILINCQERMQGNMCKETIASTSIEIKVETRDIPFDKVQYQGQEFTNCKEPKAQEWEDHII